MTFAVYLYGKQGIKDYIAGVMATKYIVMPSHIHMFLTVNRLVVGTRYIVSENRMPYMTSLREKLKQMIPKTVQQFKASVTRETKTIDLGQQSYHDHIIRNKQD